MEARPRLIGAILGFIISLLFILFHWKVVLLILGLTLVGYLVGLYFEAGTEIRRKLRELLSLFLR